MITLRPTEDGDLQALSRLFEDAFGHPLSREEWLWKYRQLPGTGRSAVAVDAAGRVLAHAGALRLPGRWAGGEGEIWQLADFVGAARGGGLRPPVVELGRWLLADLPGPGDAPWIFGFPSRRHFLLGRKVFGYGPLGTFGELTGPLPPATGGEEREPGVGRVRLEVSDSCGAWAEAVWEACATFGVRRSAAFLNWRYHARPGRYYRFYRMVGGGGEGLAVFAFVGDEAAAAELWLPPDLDARAALGEVATDLRAAGIAGWRFWPPPAVCGGGERLAGLGLEAGRDVFVGFRGGPGVHEPPPASAGFYYAMGDHDIT